MGSGVPPLLSPPTFVFVDVKVSVVKNLKKVGVDFERAVSDKAKNLRCRGQYLQANATANIGDPNWHRFRPHPVDEGGRNLWCRGRKNRGSERPRIFSGTPNRTATHFQSKPPD